jgi:hypothetical protein
MTLSNADIILQAGYIGFLTGLHFGIGFFIAFFIVNNIKRLWRHLK